MSQITTIGLKGWRKQDGSWSWTPEVVLSYDPLYSKLEPHQIKSIEEVLEQLKGVIRGSVMEGCR